MQSHDYVFETVYNVTAIHAQPYRPQTNPNKIQTNLRFELNRVAIEPLIV